MKSSQKFITMIDMKRKLPPASPQTTLQVANSVHPVASRADRRRRDILDVAGQMFLEVGYAATSMSAIAGKLGGSKATLYTYFISKEVLFAAYMQDACTKFVGELFGFAYTSDTLKQTLIGFGQRYIRLVLSEWATRMYRLVVAETARFPEVGRAFYEAGPRIGTHKLAALLDHHMQNGQLRSVDALQAARQFFGLLQPIADHVRIFNVSTTLSDAEIAEQVVAVVDLFLYGLAATSRKD